MQVKTIDEQAADLEWCARQEITRINACETYAGALPYIERYEQIMHELSVLKTGIGRE